MTRAQINLATSLVLEQLRQRKALIGNLSWLMTINITISLASLVTNAMLAHRLGAAAYGELVYALAVGAIGLVVAMCGLDRTLVRELVEAAANGRLVNCFVAGLVLRFSMLVVFALTVCGAALWIPDRSGISWAVTLVALGVSVKALDLTAIYDVWRESKRHSGYLLVERLIYLAAIWTVLFAFGRQPSTTMIGMLMLTAALTGLLLQYRWAARRKSFGIHVDTHLLAWKLVKNSCWLWTASLASLSWAALGPIFLKHMTGNTEAGGFGVAWNLVLLTFLFCTQIGRLLNPRLAQACLGTAPLRDRMRLLGEYVLLCFLSASMVGLPAIFAPKLILTTLFGLEYAFAADQFRILGIYVIVLGVGYAFGQYLICTRRDRVYVGGVMVCALLSLILYYPFVSAWAGAGAAMVLLCSHGFACMIYVAVVLLDVYVVEKTAASGASQTAPREVCLA